MTSLKAGEHIGSGASFEIPAVRSKKSLPYGCNIFAQLTFEVSVFSKLPVSSFMQNYL